MVIEEEEQVVGNEILPDVRMSTGYQ